MLLVSIFMFDWSCQAIIHPMFTGQIARTSHSGATQLSMNFFQKMLQELDNFADDAVGRRLGNGAKFYGKRRSSFYGEDDSDRKEDPSKPDTSEDFTGPGGGSYFVLSKERDEFGRPMRFLTRKEAREQRRAEEAAEYEALADSEELTESFLEALERDKRSADA